MDKREKIQSEATNIILKNNFKRIILNIAPRVGKSKIIIDSIKQSTFDNIYISSPLKVIKDNWKIECKKWGMISTPHLICHASLKKLQLNKNDLLIIDEVHTLSENNILTISNFKTDNIVGITGSLSKNTKKLLKDGLNLEEKYNYSIDQAIEDKIISDYEINIIKLKLDDVRKIEVLRGKNKILTTEKENYEYLTNRFNYFKLLSFSNPSYNFVKMKIASERADFLYKSKTKLEKAKQIIDKINRCLIFTTRIDNADFLCNNSYHYKSNNNFINDFYHQKINKLSVVNLADMGLTFPSLKKAVIHQLQSNDETAIQRVLRMCNLDKGKKAEIYITIYENTVDEEWCYRALRLLNKNKIIVHS